MADAELTGDGGHVGADGKGLRGCSCSIRCAVQQLQVLQSIGVFTVGRQHTHNLNSIHITTEEYVYTQYSDQHYSHQNYEAK